jgi:formamidopyrimidine-DNA glycosylase
MPELPEIYVLARQMNEALAGKTITAIEMVQPKSLNVPEEEFIQALTSARILGANYRGKWVLAETTQGWLMLGLGMGGEILLRTRATLPEKYRLVFDFDDNTCLTINFWWFGYAHYAHRDELKMHKMTAKLGPNALEITGESLKKMLAKRKGGVKAFLLDQSKIAGIGNVYAQDILFEARLHPLRNLDTLSESEIERLAEAIVSRLQASIDKGGLAYEVDLYGNKGGFGMDDLIVGYKEGQPCPVCGTIIEKIKTGSTSSFICPHDQAMQDYRNR